MMEIKPWLITYRTSEKSRIGTRLVCAATYDSAERMARDSVPQPNWVVEKIDHYTEENADYFVKKHMLLGLLPKEPTGKREIWHDGDEILTNDEATADKIADVLEAMGFEEVTTGYYDPIEDERNGELDKLSGYHYVSF